MHHKRVVTMAAAAVAAMVALSACSSGGEEASSPTTPGAPSPTSAPTGSDAQAHNGADVTFAQGMIPHHAQAIEMSDILLSKQDIDPRVVSLANAIKAAQGPEIEQMQGWLTEWGVAATTSSPGGGMPGMPGMPAEDMPGMNDGGGMMSEQDMTALQDAQGAEASRLFLTQMIEHHNGAITMAQTEINSGQFAPAVALARSIVSAQQQEITTMQGILDSL